MGDRHGGIGLLQARLGLRQRRRGLVPLAHGNRTIADKVAGARHIRLGLEQLRLGIRDRGDLTRNAGDARLMGLMAVGQGRDLAVEIGTCLRNPGPIDIIVDQHEQLSGLDVLEVAHQNFRDIAAHLRGDVGRPAAHQRIVRLLDPAGDRADPQSWRISVTVRISATTSRATTAGFVLGGCQTGGGAVVVAVSVIGAPEGETCQASGSVREE
jgi:hypothetical protein